MLIYILLAVLSASTLYLFFKLKTTKTKLDDYRIKYHTLKHDVSTPISMLESVCHMTSKPLNRDVLKQISNSLRNIITKTNR